MDIGTYLLGAKSGVSKKKRKIFKEADEDIQRLQKFKTAATKDVEKRAGGFEKEVAGMSDIDKAIKERARRARTLLRGLKK
ncbi:MAG: hypothetical protein PHF37_03215 [Phycisphaerae bacterium]|jgi:hypothetical protein|nr:hypothetical protein [Phycisphaerae bacterium]